MVVETKPWESRLGSQNPINRWVVGNIRVTDPTFKTGNRSGRKGDVESPEKVWIENKANHESKDQKPRESLRGRGASHCVRALGKHEKKRVGTLPRGENSQDNKQG